MPSRLRWLVALAFASCHAQPTVKLADTLIGLKSPLIPGPGLVLQVPGQVGERPAVVSFDVATPLTTVTTGCFAEPLVGASRAKQALPLGGTRVLPITQLRGLAVAGVRLRTMEAGLLEESGCAVVVGADLLEGTALSVQVATRAVSFSASREKRDYVAEVASRPRDTQVLEVTRDPKHDWPLVPVRVRQGSAELNAAFVLATSERHSRVFESVARAPGLRAGLELLHGLPIPDDVRLPKEFDQVQGIPFDALELAPNVGVTQGALGLLPGEPTHAASGALAFDVLGTFDLTLDVRAGVLLVSRPRVFASASRVQCERDGVTNAEACFELTRMPSSAGLLTTATVWRPLAEGGRLYFDVAAADLGCRIGITFSPGERGRSAQHLFPWPSLAKNFPHCAQGLHDAKDVSLGLFEEGPLEGCPGVCAFVHDLASGRTSCECQPGASGLSSDAERRLLMLYKLLLERSLKNQEPEPTDP